MLGVTVKSLKQWYDKPVAPDSDQCSGYWSRQVNDEFRSYYCTREAGHDGTSRFNRAVIGSVHVVHRADGTVYGAVRISLNAKRHEEWDYYDSQDNHA